MFNRYFQQELANLRDLGVEFSQAHPAVAPMLSGPTADPDVERLLEGVAFLTALLREKLDDEFPEIIHELIQLIWPHYLRPIPSTTTIAFTPKAMLKQSLEVPSGVHIASVPVEGASCLFKTCYDVEVHPMSLRDAAFVETSGRPPAIKLALELHGLRLSDWKPGALRLFLAGDYGGAADLYFLLRHHLTQILIAPLDGGNACSLAPDHLKPAGFALEEDLIPYPAHSFPGYRILQEYFVLPEKFLFLDLVGWERWQDRGEGSQFEVTFELHDLPFPAPRVKKEDVVLFATPAINVFPHEADPIRLDHRKTEYLVRPSASNVSQYQVYSLEKVVGFVQGTAEPRKYVPYDVLDPRNRSHPVYHKTVRRSPAKRGFDVYMSVAYPPEAGPPVPETLSIGLQCTNGPLPENLQVGDISVATSSSPEFVEFTNIRPPTMTVIPPLGTNLLWRLLSHLSLNYLSLARAENLQALLELYIFPESRDRTATLSNKRRIAGIDGIKAEASNRLVSGIMMRGREITLKMRQDHFASPGDLYLFGSILDYFFGSYASINTFTSLVIDEVMKGDHYRWPARVGDRPLI
ncbi:MAG: type VI secretion system baseplate subunit TssF [Thermodesulfobacteriota bacterium]|nr:type VI secretion system baseplate subunit TssF [Thermodesulfobacteriota bacterium]